MNFRFNNSKIIRCSEGYSRLVLENLLFWSLHIIYNLVKTFVQSNIRTKAHDDFLERGRRVASVNSRPRSVKP